MFAETRRDDGAQTERKRNQNLELYNTVSDVVSSSYLDLLLGKKGGFLSPEPFFRKRTVSDDGPKQAADQEDGRLVLRRSR